MALEMGLALWKFSTDLILAAPRVRMEEMPAYQQLVYAEPSSNPYIIGFYISAYKIQWLYSVV